MPECFDALVARWMKVSFVQYLKLSQRLLERSIDLGAILCSANRRARRQELMMDISSAPWTFH